ncbi:syntaphilin isoform X2 [Tympanuchus pallidicinctus]|uniref:syntaphilin isoform X2 n=1 Tax=Lagopus muta TaxID=64668 RepID=UPI0020A1EA17|nr:syntaphilin isoform X2 [Lagopus muta]XP_048818757.1 syntaphilin isoform X2 [Lagopus muta]XP_052539690.1 syntaphilin isoform X2 [Tympanuchus pallidicinctus]XP_052539692.1 syntaphilin isoform X2 [Tympanuchus pallidicinctus]
MSLPGSRRSSTGSRSRGLYGRSGFASFFKSSAPSATRPETQPLLPASRRPSPPGRDTYGTSSLSSSSNSGSYKGSDSSPTPRRSAKYNLCSDNHGIKPPTPEQYLTPLQQKEVCIRHLKARLKDTQERLQDRDAEIEDLKTQLSRMQEDWIEEECHRVEAQLALKEARKEIKQLKQVIDTVKNNLLEKDKGLQKYFVDINIQNKKLETLLHSMEVAQNGAGLKEEGAAESAGGSPARSLTRSSTYTKLSDQAGGERTVGGSQTISVDEGADSGFAGGDEAPGRPDLLEGGEPCGRLPPSSTYEKLLGLRGGVEAGVQASCMQERAIQTDFAHCQPDLDTLLEKVMKSQACSLGSPTSVWVSEMEDVAPGCEMPNPAGVMDLEPEDGEVPHNPTVQQPPSAGPSVAIACAPEEDATAEPGCDGAPSKSYWSRHFIVDLLAVVVPAVPTVAWLCRSQRRQGQPIYNISSLLRGCCTVALHSIRRMGCRAVSSPNPGGGAQP